jgi:acyl carrier protein
MFLERPLDKMLDKTSLLTRLLELAGRVAPGLAEIQGDPTAADLRDAGMSSVAAVRLMLDLEAAFDVAIPDAELTPENFATLRTIEALIARLKGVSAA